MTQKSSQSLKKTTSPFTNSSQEILPALEEVFHNTNSKIKLRDIVKIASEHSVIDLAYAANHIPNRARFILYDNLPSRDAKIQFVLNTDQETRSILFHQMNDQELKKLFEKMPADEAVWVMEDMSEKKFKKVLYLINQKKAIRICELKRHARNSAGRLMTSDYFAFTIDMTIKEAAEYIRDHPQIEFSRGIFIHNEVGELLGYVPSRNLIINPADTPLRRVVRPVLHKVTADTSREEVIEIVEKYKISSLPVIDKNNSLVGVITYEDVVEAMEDSTDEMFAHIAGMKDHVDYHGPVLKLFFARSPWLIVTLIAGLVNVGFMSFFQRSGEGLLTFVLFFVPLITGMSGNIGIQSSTILVRNLALGGMSGSKKEIISKELFNGVFTGVIFGIVCAIITYVLDILLGGILNVNPLAVSFIVGIGLIGACLAGTLLGVISPLFFSRVGIDPAVSSGPIITAFNDSFSMIIYFIIAWSISNIFF